MGMRGLFVAIVVLAAGATMPAAAQTGRAEQLVARATADVVAFVERFTNVVAEERYTQETTSPRRRRELVSDFLLVKPTGSRDWYQFRDVIEVDGKPVRNRDERLARLFLDASTDASARIQDVMREGTRFNLEDVGTLNKPLGGLVFLQPQYVGHFRFVFGPLDRKEGEAVRIVQFVEFMVPTILRRAAANGDLQSRGSWWIDEKTARLVKSQLRVANAEITTSFAFDRELGMNVPIEMRDLYRFRGSDLNGVAKYGRFRRFGVTTEEKIDGKAGVR